MVAGGPKTDPRCSRPGTRGTLYPELFRSAPICCWILAPAAEMRQQPWHHLHEACAGIASSLKRFSVRCCYEGITGCGYVESIPDVPVLYSSLLLLPSQSSQVVFPLPLAKVRRMKRGVTVIPFPGKRGMLSTVCTSSNAEPCDDRVVAF